MGFQGWMDDILKKEKLTTTPFLTPMSNSQVTSKNNVEIKYISKIKHWVC